MKSVDASAAGPATCQLWRNEPRVDSSMSIRDGPSARAQITAESAVTSPAITPWVTTGRATWTAGTPRVAAQAPVGRASTDPTASPPAVAAVRRRNERRSNGVTSMAAWSAAHVALDPVPADVTVNGR